MLALQKARQPEKIKPPHWIDQQLANRKGPSLTQGKKLRPLCSLGGKFAIALNVSEFLLRDARMFIRFAVSPEPKKKPQKAQCADAHERPAPSPKTDNWRNCQRGKDRSDICAGIENACGERPLFFREPLRHCFNACGKYGRFPQTERDPKSRKGREGRADCCAHRSEAPERHRQRIA